MDFVHTQNSRASLMKEVPWQKITATTNTNNQIFVALCGRNFSIRRQLKRRQATVDISGCLIKPDHGFVLSYIKLDKRQASSVVCPYFVIGEFPI